MEAMELRHLKYFVALAEKLNFTRAAAALHIAQPALSVQIRKLEEEIGTALLSREGRKVRLTEAGRVFLEQARKSISEAKRGVTLARQAANGEIGHLSIGYNTPAAFRVFPKLVPAFRKRWPEVQLTFHSLKIAQQLEGLRRNELDLSFIWLPIPQEEFDVQELARESLVAAIPSGHRLACMSSVSIRDLSREPLILLSRALDPETYHQIEQLFSRAGAVMNVAYQLENSLSMINFVAMGSGCSLLPEYVRDIRQDGVVYKPLRSPNLVKTLAMIKNKGTSSELANAFYRFAVETFPASRGEKATVGARRRPRSA
jgi:DNA-binding transcriptional LysR family regulator